MRFEEVLEYYKPQYFIKCDIETSDIHVLNGLKALAPENLPQYVSVEAHTLDCMVILRTLGYVQYKVVDQKAHGMLACSGPFGEKASGEWVGIETAAYEWLHSRVDPMTWHDFYAKRTW